jgi:hypothetical protein
MQNEMIQLTIANTLDQTAKQRVEVQGNQTLKQVVQQRNLAPNGSFDVYDQVGKVITNQAAANHRDATVYVGVAKVAGGGVPRSDLKKLQLEYPSLQPVKQWMNNGQVKMFIVRFPSNGRTSTGFWDIAVYCPNASSGLPHSYVLNFDNIVQRPSVSIFSRPPSASYASGAGNGTLPGSSRKGHWVCHGNILPHLNSLGQDPVKRMGAYINHIQNLLNA